ncbi:hypothetical protein B0H14DRAFT_3514234 [Mycena olivaceomarginata]|nr:hypothetical protein B0H14DRAFT_3514234 [Mycena olivaceomarginata]
MLPSSPTRSLQPAQFTRPPTHLRSSSAFDAAAPNSTPSRPAAPQHLSSRCPALSSEPSAPLLVCIAGAALELMGVQRSVPRPRAPPRPTAPSTPPEDGPCASRIARARSRTGIARTASPKTFPPARRNELPNNARRVCIHDPAPPNLTSAMPGSFLFLDPRISYDGLRSDFDGDDDLLSHLESRLDYHFELYYASKAPSAQPAHVPEPSSLKANGSPPKDFTARYRLKERAVVDELRGRPVPCIY